jgi:hypothetical protein
VVILTSQPLYFPLLLVIARGTHIIGVWVGPIAGLDIQGDQKVSVHLMIAVQKNTQIFFLTVSITYHDNRAILNTVFENTVRRVNKCLETGGGYFEHYL